MMRFNSIKLLTLLFPLLLTGCGADDIAQAPEPDETIVGYSVVDINANKPVVRGGEAIFGNMVADAMVYHATQLGLSVDGAIVNGGNLRFSSSNRPDGIYPSGEISRDNINEMLPFLNFIWVMELRGSQLKSSFERSAHALPIPEGSSGNGAFLQVSSNFQLTFDLSQQAQLLDELVTPPQIDTEGERLQTIVLNGVPVQDDQIYTILVPEYIGDGGDGFIALGETADNSIQITDFVTADTLESYLETFSPIAPQIENRIILN